MASIGPVQGLFKTHNTKQETDMEINELKWENNLRRVASAYGYELKRRRAQRFRKTYPGAYIIVDLRMMTAIVAGMDAPLADLEAVAAWFRREIPRTGRWPEPKYLPDGKYYSATGRWTLPGGGCGRDGNSCR